MEYASGGELFPAVFKPASDRDSDVGSPLRETRARTYFQQLVMGVQWCHEKVVAHRDLSARLGHLCIVARLTLTAHGDGITLVASRAAVLIGL